MKFSNEQMSVKDLNIAHRFIDLKGASDPVAKIVGSVENLSYEQRYISILTYEACIKAAIEASMAKSMYCSYKSKK